jgi:hypothetical protein
MAHVVFRDLFFEHGFALLQMADDERLAGALKRTWDELGDRLGDDKRVSSDGLAVTLAKAGDHLGIFIVMPEAVGRTEAARLCLLFDPPDEGEVPRGRYFTLERAFDPEGAPTNALCEWRLEEGEEEPTHVLHGFEVPDDDDSMAQAILSL